MIINIFVEVMLLRYIFCSNPILYVGLLINTKGLNESSIKYMISSLSSSSFKVWANGLFRFRSLTSEIMNLFGQLVGLLGRGISPTQGLYLHRTTQHRKKRTHIHDPSRIRTCYPNVRAAEESTCLRPRGHWNRQVYDVRV
jgi:hypothetical protein